MHLISSVCVLFLIHILSIPYIQRIDGFLAVLNVTGGDFSPQSQKLPFSVISVDGDNYLLYYSSIDLAAGNSPTKKCIGYHFANFDWCGGRTI